MSRRNTRQGKARRRAERDRLQVTERERKRARTSDQGPRAVEVQAVQRLRGQGSGPRNSDEHGSGLPSDADDGLTAVDSTRRTWIPSRIWRTRIPMTLGISTPTTPTSRPR